MTCAATAAAYESLAPLLFSILATESSTHRLTSVGHSERGRSTRWLTCAPNLYVAPNVACFRSRLTCLFIGFGVGSTEWEMRHSSSYSSRVHASAFGSYRRRDASSGRW